jgi:predicted DNA-binding protein
MKPKITQQFTVGVTEEVYQRVLGLIGQKKMADWLREAIEVYLDVLENTSEDVRVPEKV